MLTLLNNINRQNEELRYLDLGHAVQRTPGEPLVIAAQAALARSLIPSLRSTRSDEGANIIKFRLLIMNGS